MKEIRLIITGEKIVAVSNAIGMTNNYVEFLFGFKSSCTNTKVELKDSYEPSEHYLLVTFNWDGDRDIDFAKISNDSETIKKFGVEVKSNKSLFYVDFMEQEMRMKKWTKRGDNENP